MDLTPDCDHCFRKFAPDDQPLVLVIPPAVHPRVRVRQFCSLAHLQRWVTDARDDPEFEDQ